MTYAVEVVLTKIWTILIIRITLSVVMTAVAQTSW